MAPPQRSYRLSSCFVTMSDRSSDPGLSGNLRRSFLPSRAPTSYHRDQGGRSRWRHLLRLLREERPRRSEEHTSELQSLMRISYAVFCLKKKQAKHKNKQKNKH